jgi:hypothetical protein
MLSLLTLVIRIILWPLRYVSRLAFPANDLDGLSPAVCSKAAQAFLSLLQKEGYTSVDHWSTTGFVALREEATESNSLILVYLHSPLHRQANTVIRQILLQAKFQEFLGQANLVGMGCTIHSGQGAHLAQMLNATSFPLLALLQPNRNNLQLLLCVQGPVLLKMRNADIVVQYMSAALTRHQVQLAEQVALRFQREQEVQLRREQDEEYHAALRADQERLERQQQEEEARLREEREAIEREERDQREKEGRLLHAQNLVGVAPERGGTRIRFVLPSGKKLERRFESSATIGVLKAYLMLEFHNSDESEGFERIGLSTNYPKQTYEDDDLTLEEAGLSPQAVLMVQDLDA